MMKSYPRGPTGAHTRRSTQAPAVTQNIGFDVVPIVFDQRAEIVVTFDPDTGDMTNSYNGAVLGSGNDWNFWLGGAVELAAIDLYAPHTATVYDDDLELSPAGGDDCLDGMANCNGDDRVNTQDFLCFLGAWSAAFQSGNDDATVDCKGDNAINTQDFLCFLGLWAGCH